jgi:predicted GIY-YIG superfamily endonuclease
MTGNGEGTGGVHHVQQAQRRALHGRHVKPAPRVHQHREGLTEGFSRRYGCKRLVWYELHADMPGAIKREKQLKGGSRGKKVKLIEAMNPKWDDRYSTIVF